MKTTKVSELEKGTQALQLTGGQVAAQEQMSIIGQYFGNMLTECKKVTIMDINRLIMELRILLAHSTSEKEELELTDRFKEAQHIKEALSISENRIFRE